jgi:hypothetical protein
VGQENPRDTRSTCIVAEHLLEMQFNAAHLHADCMTDEVQSANQLMPQFSWFDESPLKRLSEWARHRRVVAARKVLPGLANRLRCLHSSTQIAAVQTSRRRSRWIECEHSSTLWISTKPSSLAAAPAATAHSGSLGTRSPAENRGPAQDARPGRATPQPARVTPAGRCARPGNA